WGGEDQSFNLLSTGGRYNPSTDSWAPTNTSNAPSARYYPPSVWTGSEMIVWGGSQGGVGVNTGGRYNPSTDSWTATSTTNAPSARVSHTAVWNGSEMVVWGGQPYTNTGESTIPVPIAGRLPAPSTPRVPGRLTRLSGVAAK